MGKFAQSCKLSLHKAKCVQGQRKIFVYSTYPDLVNFVDFINSSYG